MESSAPYSRLAGVYDELVVDPCFAQWAEFIAGLWIGDRIERALDLCCGTGLMTFELACRVPEVVGLDASPAMLDLARRRPELQSAGNVTLIEAVLPDLPVAGEFDAVVSTFDGLNYLPADDLARTFLALAPHVRSGGWFVFDVHGEVTEDFLRSNPVLEGSDEGRTFRLTSSVNDDSRACSTTIDLIHSDPALSFTETHVQYLHSTAELHDWLSAAHFEVVRVVNEYTDEPADADTLRATWIARKVGTTSM